MRLGDAEDPAAKARVLDRERELGHRVWGAERAQAYGDAPLSITPEVGDLLSVLVLARRPCTIVEFGACWVRVKVVKPRKFSDVTAVGVQIERRAPPPEAQLSRAGAVLRLIGSGMVPGH